MSRRKLSRIAGGATIDVPPPTGPVNTKIGYQWLFFDYWGEQWFCNLMHTATGAWSELYQLSVPFDPALDVDANGWLTIRHNVSCGMSLLLGEANVWRFNRGGTYVVTNENGLTCSLSDSTYQTYVGGRISSPTVVSANRWECTVAEGNAPWALSIQVKNTTGSTQNCNNIKVFHIDDEADINAGRMMSYKMRENLQGVSHIRAPEQAFFQESYYHVSNDLVPVTFAKWPTEAALRWSNEKMPWSAFAKVARDLNCDLWINIPAKFASNSDITQIAQAIAANLPAPLRVHVEIALEATWNYAYPYNVAQSYLRDIVAPTLSNIVDSNGNATTPSDGYSYGVAATGCAYLYVAANAWRLFDAVFGRSRVVHVLPGWAGGPGLEFALQSTFGYSALWFVDPVSGIQGKNLVDHFAIAPYFTWETGGTATSLNGRWQKDNKIHALPGDGTRQYIYDASIAGIDAWTQTIPLHVTKLSQVAPNVKLTLYESGDDQRQNTQKNHGSVTATIATSDNTLNNNGNFGWWGPASGQRLRITGSVAGTNLATNALYYARYLSGSKIRLYTTSANYSTDTPLTLTGNAIEVTLRNYDQDENYAGEVVTSDNTITALSDLVYTASFDDGERAIFADCVGTGLTEGTKYYVKFVTASTTKLEVYTDAAMTARVTLTSNGKVMDVDNYERIEKLAKAQLDVRDGSSAPAMWQYYFSKFDGQVQAQTIHTFAGSRFITQPNSLMENGTNNATPLITWLKATATARKGSI